MGSCASKTVEGTKFGFTSIIHKHDLKHHYCFYRDDLFWNLGQTTYILYSCQEKEFPTDFKKMEYHTYGFDLEQNKETKQISLKFHEHRRHEYIYTINKFMVPKYLI